MTHDDMAYEETEDRFYAQFDSREVELMTLDQLAEAFEAGRIHGNTYVCREGESEWATLSEVAGLGEEEAVAEPEPAPPSVIISERRPPMPERRPAMNTVPAARFAAAAAPPSVAPSFVPVVSSTPLSFAPVSSTIDYSSVDLDDEMALRPKRRWGRVLVAAAALTVVGGGAAFALGGGAHALASAIPSTAALEAAGSKSQASLTLDAIKPADPAVAAAVPAAPAPEPVAAVAPPADAPTAAAPLSDDVKQALLAQDKAHQAKHTAKLKARAGSGVAHHGKAISTGGFKSGGSAYDPLNGKL